MVLAMPNSLPEVVNMEKTSRSTTMRKDRFQHTDQFGRSPLPTLSKTLRSSKDLELRATQDKHSSRIPSLR